MMASAIKAKSFPRLCGRCGGPVLYDGFEPVCLWCGDRPDGFGRFSWEIAGLLTRGWGA